MAASVGVVEVGGIVVLRRLEPGDTVEVQVQGPGVWF